MVNEREREYRETPEVPVRSSELRDDDRLIERDDDRLRDDRVIASQPATEARRDARRTEASDYEVELPQALNLEHDRVRWGAIWAGLLAAVGSLLVLSLLGLAIGATTIDPGATGEGGLMGGDAGLFSAIWAGAAGVISFFIGGLVASRAAAIFDRGWGALNGAMVFLLAIPVTLILGFMGLGGLLGMAGNLAIVTPFDPAAMQAGTAQAPDAAQTAAMVRDGAWGALLALVLGLSAAIIGGALGARRTLNLERTSAQLRRD